MRSYLLGGTALRSAILFGTAAALALPAQAQTAAPDPAAATAAEPAAVAPVAAPQAPSDATVAETDSIIVTGSRIVRPNIDSPSPIASIAGGEFFQTGNVNIGDVLNQLPQLHNTFSSSNSTRFIGTQGLNLLDLRGLGTQRTLVLINGRRQVTSALLSTGNEVDTNTIPTDLIERVDVVTGGTSAVYGSDAISGVVNFVLKQNYDGFQVKGQGGVSQYGDMGSYYVSGLAGKNFGDGRGNVAVAVEYAKQNPTYASDRAHYRHRDGFIQVDSDPSSAVNGSDGIPDYQFVTDIRSRIYSDGGLIENFNTNQRYVFQSDGSLVPLTTTPVGLSGNSGVGGNGATFRNADQLGLVPSQDRIIANLLGHYDVSSAFKPYVEAKYFHNHVIGGQSGPSFGARGSLGDTYYTDNPFLSAQALGVIRGAYADGTFDSGDGINDADEYGFYLNRNNVDLGSRIDDTKRDLYRIVLGARGDLGSSFNYDVSANYGQFKEHNTNRGNLDVQRYLLATDAVRDPATGNIVCRAQIDPTAASIDAALGWSGGAGSQFLASDIANCVPLNVFGSGVASQAAKNYVTPLTHSVAKATQLDIQASINGDSSRWFQLPGGPVKFSLGVEYRRETQSQSFDQYVRSGVTFLNAIAAFHPPSLEVKEAFGELEVPIIKDRPFFDKLILSGAFRVSDYKGSTGTVWAYNGGGIWAPIPDITFRANYSRAVRSPALTELYNSQSQNYATVTDPCSADHIGEGTDSRAANCAAAGRPADFNYVYDQSLEIRSGGNPKLKAETSDSITVGAIIQPRFIPGFSLSVDYYKITVNKVISSPDAQDILDNCYDSPSLNNEFCGLFQRAGASGGPNGEEPFRIIEGSLTQILLNYAKLKVSGIDAELTYSRKIAPNVTLSFDINTSYNIKNNSYTSLADPSFYQQNLYNLSYPKWQGNLDSNLKIGSVTLGYQLRYIGKMVPDDIADISSVDGRAPQNADYTNFDYYKPVWYHDARIALDVNDKFNIYSGVDNFTNKLPPYGLTGVGGGSGIYDNRGRYFYAGVTAKF